MGKSNTLKIVETEGVEGFAANICDELPLGGKLDWFLPSVDELELMYNKKDIIGGFTGSMVLALSNIVLLVVIIAQVIKVIPILSVA